MMNRIPPTLHTYRVPQQVIDRTGQLLAEPGREGFEAAVVWVGNVLDPTVASVAAVFRPGQTSYKSADGCGVEVSQEAITELVSALPAGMFVLARLHTHPGWAYHSPVDDQNMLIAHQGAISIVVPDFASAPIDLRRCSVNELRHGSGWAELSSVEVAERFMVDE